MDDFSLARPAGHLIMGDGSGPDGLATKDGAKALSRAGSVDTATTQLNTPSRTKNLITEYYHGWRTHLSLAMDCPEPRPVHGHDRGKVIAIPEVGGLHHHYERMAG